MKEVIVYNGQTLFDISAQEYGTIEGVFDIAMANGIGITDTLTAGQKLKIPDSDPVNVQPEIVAYFKKNNIHPATGETNVVETVIPTPATGGCEWTEIQW